VYPVLLYDKARESAAVAELRVPAAGEAPPVIRLTRCGAATVRLLDASGTAVAGQRPSVWFWLGDDRPAGGEGADKDPGSAAIDASRVDPRHYLPGPLTAGDGVLQLPALIPGMQYTVQFADRAGRVISSKPFRVQPGESVRLPDLVMPPDVEHAGGAEPAVEKPAKPPEATEDK
jgi:hypothetical protein